MIQENLPPYFEILTTHDAARYIAKSDAYLRANHQRLGIKAYRIGKQLRFRRSELDSWLDTQATQ